MKQRIRSVIPRTAKEVERKVSGTGRAADYFVRGKLVGRRHWDSRGELSGELSFRNKRAHGIWRRWHSNGQLMWQTRYENGYEHGVARQWNEKGELIGSYRMNMGTGVDLWWDSSGKLLAEERHMLTGERHGFERWWIKRNEISEESHFQFAKEHGVFRRWSSGKLERGYPKFFIAGTKVTKRRYLSAAKTDATLPPYSAKDDLPRRRPLSLPLDRARRLVR